MVFGAFKWKRQTHSRHWQISQILSCWFCLPPGRPGGNTKDDVDINLLRRSQNYQCMNHWVWFFRMSNRRKMTCVYFLCRQDWSAEPVPPHLGQSAFTVSVFTFLSHNQLLSKLPLLWMDTFTFVIIPPVTFISIYTHCWRLGSCLWIPRCWVNPSLRLIQLVVVHSDHDCMQGLLPVLLRNTSSWKPSFQACSLGEKKNAWSHSAGLILSDVKEWSISNK